ncbi:hypothetical protein NDU88_008311, partial [Pleurodeles waltl]
RQAHFKALENLGKQDVESRDQSFHFQGRSSMQQASTAKQQAEGQFFLQHPALLPGRMSSVQEWSEV